MAMIYDQNGRTVTQAQYDAQMAEFKRWCDLCGEYHRWLHEAEVTKLQALARANELQIKLDRLPIDWDTENDALKQANDALRKDLLDLRAELKIQDDAIERARDCIRFFRSVIQSGEDWTDACEQAFRAALQKDEGE